MPIAQHNIGFILLCICDLQNFLCTRDNLVECVALTDMPTHTYFANSHFLYFVKSYSKLFLIASNCELQLRIVKVILFSIH